MELHILDLTNIQVNFDLDNSKLKKIIIQERGEKLSLNVSMADHYPAVTYAAAEHQGRLFWITCKRLKLLRKASHLQVIQNSVPSVVRQHQCDIRICILLAVTKPLLDVRIL